MWLASREHRRVLKTNGGPFYQFRASDSAAFNMAIHFGGAAAVMIPTGDLSSVGHWVEGRFEDEMQKIMLCSNLGISSPSKSPARLY